MNFGGCCRCPTEDLNLLLRDFISVALTVLGEDIINAINLLNNFCDLSCFDMHFYNNVIIQFYFIV